MDVRTVRYRPEHLTELGQVEAAEGGTAISFLDPAMQAALSQYNSWTHLDGEGRVVACGGTIQQWPGRHLAWLYLTQQSARSMLPLTRAVRRVLDQVPGRVEATVLRGFEPGHRFARMLGFRVENDPGVLKAYGPGGEDHIAYVRGV